MNILDGPVFIGPHACGRFRERVAALSDDEARVAILMGLCGLDGQVSWRVHLGQGAVIASVTRGTYTFRAVLKRSTASKTGETAVVTILPKEPTHVTEKRFRARRIAATDELLESELRDFDAA